MSLSIRRVRADDQRRLLDWRNADRVRRVSIDDRVIDEHTHAAWFARVLEASPPTALVVESADRPVGLVRLGNIVSEPRSCTWSCHLGEADVAPGVGACLPVIGIGFGIESWGAELMHAEVLGSNRNMLGIHRRLGIRGTGVLHGEVVRADFSEADLVQFEVRRDEWTGIRDAAGALLPSALRTDLATVLDSLQSVTID
ncbi:MAG: hypothetical protein AAFY28_02805 [Actinomycetota bacterium]